MILSTIFYYASKKEQKSTVFFDIFVSQITPFPSVVARSHKAIYKIVPGMSNSYCIAKKSQKKEPILVSKTPTIYTIKSIDFHKE